ncbi:ethylmalonyl-CoA decarboxylase isoform X2 [Caloenas nicobarica]|uniref:ethylmalonyl-CoA decarboxylase isoform X2 n=1 Tax=Caloenas nicobarica TaxID=187106 RepID=UPI0032B797BA
MAASLWKNLLQTTKERILQQRRASLYVGAHGYEEELIKKKLQQFPGGSIDLSKEDNGIGILILNNPKLMNAFTGTMMLGLQERVTELENWKDGKGLIIYGAGNTFCSGSDLNAVKAISNSQVDDAGERNSVCPQAHGSGAGLGRSCPAGADCRQRGCPPAAERGCQGGPPKSFVPWALRGDLVLFRWNQSVGRSPNLAESVHRGSSERDSGCEKGGDSGKRAPTGSCPKDREGHFWNCMGWTCQFAGIG